MRKRYYIILAVLVVAGIGAYIGVTMFREQTPDLINKKPDVTIKATELIAAFDRDTSSAKNSYVGKIIEVSGMVVSIDTSGAVVLGEEGNPSSVTVSLHRKHIEDHKKLKTGTNAVLKGKCTGYSKQANADPDDLLAILGTTVELNFANVVENK